MSYRLWYAQLDLFDTARRYLAILSRWGEEAPSRDRLFVSDFYFVNPSLLHLTHMTIDVRKTFSTLRIPKPDETFVQHPSPPILYNKMGGIQAQALHNIVGKGLVDVELVNNDQYRLSEEGRELANQLGAHLILPGESEVLKFGGADKNLDWFYVTMPRLFRYSIGLRAPSDILIRFSLYHRM